MFKKKKIELNSIGVLLSDNSPKPVFYEVDTIWKDNELTLFPVDWDGNPSAIKHVYPAEFWPLT
jgi:hypothetical protein